MDVNEIHHPERPPDTTNDIDDPFCKLADQAKPSKTYCLQATFGIKLREIFPHVLTVDTTPRLSLIHETVLIAEMRNLIEPDGGVMLRCAWNTHVPIVTFYFGVMQNVSPKLLV